MEAFKRDTRIKLAHNPTGELIKIITPCLLRKIAVKLRAFRAAAWPLIFLTLSCTKDELPPLCPDGDCNAVITAPFQKDANGFYHAELDWSRDYLPYFTIDVDADKTDEWYWYNDQPAVSARFDTDTYFVLGDSIAFTIPLYQPYGGLETYSGFPIAVQDTIVYLNQFAGTIVPVVQNDTRIYFEEKDNGRFMTKRTVGPFPPELIGDTISIYMKVYWDGGSVFEEKDYYEEKFIIE